MEGSTNKRKLPEISFENVNWRQLFLKYDEDKNGEIDAKEFTFFVKDLMALRDNNDHVPLEDAVAASKAILRHSSFDTSESQSSTSKISSITLQQAANDGAFEDEQLLPEYFMLLSGDDDAVPPLLQRVSSDSVRNEQSLRPKVQEAVRLGKLKSQENKANANGKQVMSSIEHELFGNTKACAICYDQFEIKIMYGGGFIPKTCACNILLCLTCLASSARTQMVENRRPTCPHMISTTPPRRCTVPIDQSLIAQLFKNICPLCEAAPAENNPLLPVGCLHDVYHTFCSKCLFDRIHTHLKEGKTLQCPRYSECHGELEEAAIRNIFSNITPPPTPTKGTSLFTPPVDKYDVDDFLERWFEQRLRRIRLDYRYDYMYHSTNVSIKYQTVSNWYA